MLGLHGVLTAIALLDSTSITPLHWGHRVVLAVTIAVGALLAADGIGLLFGQPLVPAPPPAT